LKTGFKDKSTNQSQKNYRPLSKPVYFHGVFFSCSSPPAGGRSGGALWNQHAVNYMNDTVFAFNVGGNDFAVVNFNLFSVSELFFCFHVV
jgi:hypothetical protein